jgi:hypothetical protein
VKHPRESETASTKLATLLEIAREQRELLARGDLEALETLQQRRQQLLSGIQSLDEEDRGDRGTIERILALDKEMVCLLSSELVDIHDKMQKIFSIRKLLRSRPHADRRPVRHLSRHI